MKFSLWCLLATLAFGQNNTEKASTTSVDQSTSTGSSKDTQTGSTDGDKKNEGSRDDGKTGDQSGGKSSGKDDIKDTKNSTKRDPFNNPMIVMYEPIYIETIKRSSISIDKPCNFKWRLEGKPAKQPDSFTLTLLEKKASDVTYVIATNISVSDTSFLWDIPSYRPSQNDDEAIYLKPGGIYKMIIHDAAVKYNTLPSKERYALSAREFTLYSSSDPNSKFSSASLASYSTGLALILFVTISL